MSSIVIDSTSQCSFYTADMSTLLLYISVYRFNDYLILCFVVYTLSIHVIGLSGDKNLMP
jgi:hypothetical protein